MQQSTALTSIPNNAVQQDNAVQQASLRKAPVRNPQPMPSLPTPISPPLPPSTSLADRTFNPSAAAIPPSALGALRPIPDKTNYNSLEEHYLDKERKVHSANGRTFLSFTLRELARFIHGKFLEEFPKEAKDNIYMVNAFGLWHFNGSEKIAKPSSDEDVSLTIFTDLNSFSLFKHVETFLSERDRQFGEESKQVDADIEEPTIASFITTKNPLSAPDGECFGITTLLNSNLRIRVYYQRYKLDKGAKYPINISATSRHALHYQFDPFGQYPSSLSVFEGDRWVSSINYDHILKKQYEIYIEKTKNPFLFILHLAIEGWTPVPTTDILKCFKLEHAKIYDQNAASLTICGHARRGLLLYSLRNFLAFINGINSSPLGNEDFKTVKYFLGCYIKFLPSDSFLIQLLEIVNPNCILEVFRVVQLVVIYESWMRKFDHDAQNKVKIEFQQENLFLSERESKRPAQFLRTVIETFSESKNKFPEISREIPEERLQEMCLIIDNAELIRPNKELLFIATTCWNFRKESSQPPEFERLIELSHRLNDCKKIVKNPVDETLLNNAKENLNILLNQSRKRYPEMDVEKKLTWIAFLYNHSQLKPSEKDEHFEQLLKLIPTQELLDSPCLYSVLVLNVPKIRNSLVEVIFKFQLLPSQKFPVLFALLDMLPNKFERRVLQWIKTIPEGAFKIEISEYWLENHEDESNLDLILEAYGTETCTENFIKETVMSTIERKLAESRSLSPKLIDAITCYFNQENLRPEICQLLLKIYNNKFNFSKTRAIFDLIIKLNPSLEILRPILGEFILQIPPKHIGNYFPFFWKLRPLFKANEDKYRDLFIIFNRIALPVGLSDPKTFKFFLRSFLDEIRNDTSNKEYLKSMIELLAPKSLNLIGSLIEAWMTYYPIDNKDLEFIWTKDPKRTLKHIHRIELDVNLDICLAMAFHIQKDTKPHTIQKIFDLTLNSGRRQFEQTIQEQPDSLTRVQCLERLFFLAKCLENFPLLEAQCESLKNDWKEWFEGREAVKAFAHYAHQNPSINMLPAGEFYLTHSSWHGLDFIIRIIPLLNNAKQGDIIDKVVDLFVQLPEKMIINNRLRYALLFNRLENDIKFVMESPEKRVKLLTSISQLSTRAIETLFDRFFEYIPPSSSLCKEIYINHKKYSLSVLLKTVERLRLIPKENWTGWEKAEAVKINLIFDELLKKWGLTSEFELSILLDIKKLYQSFLETNNEIFEFKILQKSILSILKTKDPCFITPQVPASSVTSHLFNALYHFDFEAIVILSETGCDAMISQIIRHSNDVLLEPSNQWNNHIDTLFQWIRFVVLYELPLKIENKLFARLFAVYGNVLVLRSYYDEIRESVQKGKLEGSQAVCIDQNIGHALKDMQRITQGVEENVQAMGAAFTRSMLHLIIQMKQEMFPQSVNKFITTLLPNNSMLMVQELKYSLEKSPKKKPEVTKLFRIIREFLINKPPEDYFLYMHFCWLEALTNPLTEDSELDIKIELSSKCSRFQVLQLTSYYLVEIKNNNIRPLAQDFLKHTTCTDIEGLFFTEQLLLIVNEAKKNPIVLQTVINDLTECWVIVAQSCSYLNYEGRKIIDQLRINRQLVKMTKLSCILLIELKFKDKLIKLDYFLEWIRKKENMSNACVCSVIITTLEEVMKQINLSLLDINQPDHKIAHEIYDRVLAILGLMSHFPILMRDISTPAFVKISDSINASILTQKDKKQIENYSAIYCKIIVFFDTYKDSMFIDKNDYNQMYDNWMRFNRLKLTSQSAIAMGKSISSMRIHFDKVRAASYHNFFEQWKVFIMQQIMESMCPASIKKYLAQIYAALDETVDKMKAKAHSLPEAMAERVNFYTSPIVKQIRREESDEIFNEHAWRWR